MKKKLFISYSRKNLQEVKDLYKKLNELGHSLWMDEEDLLPGQLWENEIKKVIDNAQAVLMCLSSKWINERGYVQKELKMVLDAMEKVPDGEIYLIPIKLDDCSVPQSLEKVHWVNLYESSGFEKLQRTLNSFLNNITEGEVKSIKAIDAYSDFKEFLITHATLIYSDPWSWANSIEERDFKDLLKGRWDKSLDYLEIQNFNQIIYLWEPLFNNPFFKIDHDEWYDKPFFRCQIHSAKCHLFMAYAQLGQVGDFEEYVPKAFTTLKEVLTGRPYSMKGASSENLTKNQAKTQNLNYKDALIFAQEWFRGWSPTVLMDIFKIPIDESRNVQLRIAQRLSEIEFLLNLEEN